MLANRLMKIASDVLAEWQTYHIQQLINEALNLTRNAHAQNDQQYEINSNRLREQAQLVINNTILKQYPTYLRNLFFNSDYNRVAPGRIARIIFSALPPIRSQVMPSPELMSLLEPTIGKIGELRALVNASNAFHVEPIVIPEGKIGLDLIFPRELFNDDPKISLKYQAAFIDSAASIIEIATGSAASPAFVYSSTSALIIGIALTPSAAWGMIKLYEGLLDAALKHVQLLQAIKTVRAAAPTQAVMTEQQVKDIFENHVHAAVQKAVTSGPRHASEERLNELINALDISGSTMAEAILGGARVGISLESLDTTAELTAQAHIQLEKGLSENIKDRRELEKRLEVQLELFQGVPLLVDAVDDKNSAQ